MIYVVKFVITNVISCDYHCYVVLLTKKLGEDGESAGNDDDESLSDWNLREYFLTVP